MNTSKLIGSMIEAIGPIELAMVNKNKIKEGFVEGDGQIELINKDKIEGFTSGEECCPDGYDKINNECKKVCLNCKYNNCQIHSQNIGQVYNYEENKKAIFNSKMNDDIFDYFISEIDN